MTSKRDGIRERKNGDGKTSYQAKIRMRGFPHLSRTFIRKTDAKKWIEDTKAAIRGGNAPSTEAQRTTLKEALERYLREPPRKKDGKPLKGWPRQADRARAWIKHPLAFRFLSQLRSSDFADYRDDRRKQGKQENTIRIELAMVSKLFKIAAREWRMEGLKNPLDGVEKPGGSNERKRRFGTPKISAADEEKDLFERLRLAGAYMAPLAELAIETAMRQGELLALTWTDIDLQKRIASLKDSKNSEPRDVALSPRALEILRTMPRPLKDDAPLFPISQDEVIRTFRNACRDAKIENFKFHDLRHEAVSRLFAQGLNVAEVAAISGHKTWSQLKRYTQLRAEDLARKLA